MMRRVVLTSFFYLTTPAGIAAFSPATTGSHHVRLMDTSLAAGPGDAELVSAILVAGSAAAAFHGTKTAKADVKATPAPAPVEKEEQVAAAPVVEPPKPAPVEPPKPVAVVAPAPAPAPQKTAPVPSSPKPVAVTMSTSEPQLARSETRTASESLTDLVQQVGKTVEQNKEMEDLVKARRQQEAEKEDAEVQAATAVLTKEKTTPKKRGIIGKAWRVTKKVVAPWRKWENIS